MQKLPLFEGHGIHEDDRIRISPRGPKHHIVSGPVHLGHKITYLVRAYLLPARANSSLSTHMFTMNITSALGK